MNIFVLDHDPAKCAQFHVDKHVVKMILETAQLLSTAHRVLDENKLSPEMDSILYKKTHQNHPCAIWVRDCSQNYAWTYTLFGNLLREYTYRYTKQHASTKLIDKLIKFPQNILRTENKTPFKLAMPEQYKTTDPVESYRNYYNGEKRELFSWKNRKVPEWVI